MLNWAEQILRIFCAVSIWQFLCNTKIYQSSVLKLRSKVSRWNFYSLVTPKNRPWGIDFFVSISILSCFFLLGTVEKGGKGADFVFEKWYRSVSFVATLPDNYSTLLFCDKYPHCYHATTLLYWCHATSIHSAIM